MLFAIGSKRKKSIYRDLKAKNLGFRLFCVGVLVCCSLMQAMGQLTAHGADGKATTSYQNTSGNRDTIFVFNQTPQAKPGNLSLQQAGTNTFRWYRFNYVTKKFADTPFATITNANATAQDTLSNSGYKVTVTPSGSPTPSSTYVAWIYLNPGFNFKLYKDANGEVIWTNKSCYFTDFPFDENTPTVQSSFVYYDPNKQEPSPKPLTLNNKITFTMKPGSAPEFTVPLNTQGKKQYLRDNSPPHEDTQYYFRANDMFGIERKDEIMYRTIIPYVTLNTPVLPDVDPTSAPVPVKFTCQPNKIDLQTSEYAWRFGNGDTVLYKADNTPPDTIKYTYYTPKSSGYQVTLMVTSQWGCTYTTPSVKITVDNPQLEVANVFTPNGDNINDYFKPVTVSLRQFEISIFTRAGQRIYHFKGNDLRSWKGWDGRIENTGNDAAEGVYFFVVKGVGWDEPPTVYDDKSRKSVPPQTFGGSFYLYR